MNNRITHKGDIGNAGGTTWLLGIDTSTEQLGLALTNGEAVLELSLPGGRQQTQDLLPTIDWLLGKCGIAIRDVGSVAVAIGPGSFTGLRVGLSVAKGLAIAQGAAVIGVPTLEMVAQSYRATGVPLIAVLPAGRSRLVWALVDPGEPVNAPVNSGLDDLLAAAGAAPDRLVVGELSSSVHEALVAQGARVEDRLPGTRRAAALVGIGWQRWRAGDTDDAASLEPVYLHGKQTALPPRSQR